MSSPASAGIDCALRMFGVTYPWAESGKSWLGSVRPSGGGNFASYVLPASSSAM